MTRAKIVVQLLVSLLVIVSLGSPSESDDNNTQPPVHPLTLRQVANPQRFFGLDSMGLFKSLGRPVMAATSGDCCNFDDYRGTYLYHVYELENGGRIGFLFAQPWHIIGVVFDNLNSAHYYSLNAFFPSSDPRKERLTTCVEKSPMHVEPGESTDDYDRISEVVGKWTSPQERQVVVRYRLDDQGFKAHDLFSSSQAIAAPSDLSRLKMVAWGYFASDVSIGDLHLARGAIYSTQVDDSACTHLGV